MEATWSTMEKKEKIMWIKKAAEDQKRYEVSSRHLVTVHSPVDVSSLQTDHLCGQQRDLCEMRSPAAAVASGKKMKFEGEPKKPPSYVRLFQPFQSSQLLKMNKLS